MSMTSQASNEYADGMPIDATPLSPDASMERSYRAYPLFSARRVADVSAIVAIFNRGVPTIFTTD